MHFRFAGGRDLADIERGARDRHFLAGAGGDEEAASQEQQGGDDDAEEEGNWAGVGAVGGGVRGSDRWNHHYWKRYKKCMRR